MKDTLLREQVTSLQYLGFSSSGFNLSPQFPFYRHCLQANSVWL